MTPAERDAFLAEQRTCRVATCGASGEPHVAPLWYAWDGSHLWLYSIVRSRRMADIGHNPRVAAVIDAGVAYAELRGVELGGVARIVGESPRRGEPCAELEEPERLFSARYGSPGEPWQHDGRHAWVRVDVDREVSWDFRKLG